MADFEITGTTEGEVLHLVFSGESTTVNAKAMVTRYFELVQGCGAKKVLADLRVLRGRLALGETYLLMRKLPVEPLPRGIRTAILEADEHRTYAEFFETTSANAGIHLKCFFDRDAALDWLRTA